MKAITYDRYGPVDVLQFEDIPTPEPKSDEILIRVRAAAVTTADWRMRSLEMPGAMRIIGRLMFGILGPRNRVLGIDIAGDVAKVGPSVTTFKPGDAVFGHIGKGGHAEFAIAKEKGAIVPKPEALTYEEAAALPFGALCALVFLRDFAKLQEGQQVLVIGASGNVGSYAVQIAKAMGSHVTAVASGPNADLVRRLGAEEFVDYQTTDITALEQKYDVIFDTYGALSFAAARKILTSEGRFLPLNFSLGEALGNLLVGWTRKQKMITAVNSDSSQDLLELIDLVQRGLLVPLIDRTYGFAEMSSAYRHVEGRRRRGAVVLQVDST